MLNCLQSASRFNGCGVVSITFLVDERGDVLFYTEPTTRRIEPSSRKEVVAEWFAANGRG